jgi:hypothetical protein
MLAVPLDKRVRRSVSVTVGEGLEPVVSTAPGPFFAAHLLAPQADNGLLDSSPRTTLSPWRLYWDRRGPDLQACDRIENPGDDTYELISKPRAVNAGRRVVGFSCPVLPIAALYPRQAEIRLLGSEEALATVECAVYSARETDQQHGTYEDTFCEMPAAAWATVGDLRNAQLHFDDGSTWTLVEATLGTELPYVNASIRKLG